MDQNNNLYQIENLPRQNENFIFSNNIIIMDQNNNSYENENFNNSDSDIENETIRKMLNDCKINNGEISNFKNKKTRREW